MIKLLSHKISRKILKEQDASFSNLFVSINNNNNKLKLLDIGGADGLRSRWKLFERYIEVIFVEPDKRSSLELKQKGFKVIDKAFWSSNDKKEFYLTKKLHVSSLYKPNREFIDKFSTSSRYDIINTIILDVDTLDNQIHHENIPHFIKIDVQGAELEILKGGIKTLQNVMGLEVEVNFKEIYKNMPLYSEIESFLKEQGFALIDYTNLYRWERSTYRGFGEIVHGDAIFIRTPETIIEMGENLSDPISLFENYIKILLIYNRIDLIKTFAEYISFEYQRLFNIDAIILFLDKKYKRINFVDYILSYFTRYLISKNFDRPHWKL